MQFNRAAKRLLKRAQKITQVVAKESADDRVKAEAKEYLRGVTESINREQNAPKDMLVVICQFEQEVDQKDMEILTLRAELDRFHDEHPCLAPCEAKPTKEIVMAKFDLDMQNVEVSGVKLGSIIVHIDVPDTAFDVLATVYKEALPLIFGQIKRDVECRCAAHNEYKHPTTAM